MIDKCKFFGRQKELSELKNIFLKAYSGNFEVVYLKGKGGIGKTSVFNEFTRILPVHGSCALYLNLGNKYSSFYPYSNLLESINILFESVCRNNTDSKLNAFWEDCKKKFDCNIPFLTSVIPETKKFALKMEGDSFCDKQSNPLSCFHERNRFFVVISDLLSTLAYHFRPLVIFIDSAEHIDKDTLEFFKFFLSYKRHSSVMFFLSFTYISDKYISQNLMDLLTNIKNDLNTVHEIHLGPIEQKDVKQMILCTHQLEPKKIDLLLSFIEETTSYNPAWVKIFFSYLCESKILFLNKKTGLWDYEYDSLTKKDLATSIEDILYIKLRDFDGDFLTLLVLAITMEDSFFKKSRVLGTYGCDENTLNMFMEKSLSTCFFDYNSVNFAHNDSDVLDGQYGFICNTIKDMLYFTISSSILNITHGRLWEQYSNISLEKINVKELFMAVYHLDRVNTIDDNYRQKVCELRTLAGKRALSLFSYNIAYLLFEEARALFDNAFHADLEEDIYTGLIESSFLTEKYSVLEIYLDEVLGSTMNPLVKLKAHEVKHRYLFKKGDFYGAINSAIEMFNLINIKTSTTSSRYLLVVSYLRAKMFIPNKKQYDSILGQNISKNQQIEQALKTLQNTYHYYMLAFSTTESHLGLIELEVAMKYGIFNLTPISLEKYACLICTQFDQIDKAYELGRFGISLSEKSDFFVKQRVYYMYYTYIHHRKKHCDGSISPLLDAFLYGIRAGDFEYTFFCALTFCMHYFYLGRDFNKLKNDCNEFINTATALQYKDISNIFLLIIETCDRFCDCNHGEETSNKDTDNYFYNLEESGLDLKEGRIQTRAFGYFQKAIVNYLHGYYEKALNNLRFVENNLEGLKGTVVEHSVIFYSTIIMLILCQDKENKRQLNLFRKKIFANINILQTWANFCNDNYDHKYSLIQGKVIEVFNTPGDAAQMYEIAIDDASSGGFTFDEAHGLEFCGDYYFSQGKPRLAAFYIQNAYECYRKCNVLLRAKKLKEKYPDVFNLVSKDREDSLQSFYSSESLLGTKSNVFFNYEELEILINRVSGKFGKGIYEEIVSVSIDFTKAKRALLFIENRGRLDVKIDSNSGEDFFEGDKNYYPSNIINTAAMVKEEFVAGSIDTVKDLELKQYMENNMVNSVLCLPLLSDEKLMGLLYLESDKVELFNNRIIIKLKTLCQLAVQSIENTEIQESLKQKNDEIGKSYGDIHEELLKARQKLMNVVSIVNLNDLFVSSFNEFGKPFDVCLKNNSQILEVLEDFSHVRNNGSKDSLDELQVLGKLADAGDNLFTNLTFCNEVRSTILRVLGDMKNGEERTFDVYAYIEDILFIISPVIKNTKHTVTLTCDKDLVLKSIPGAIAQVLIDLIMYSIHYSFAKNQKGKIFIETLDTNEELSLLYRDTGVAVDERTLSDIFEPFNKINTDMALTLYKVQRIVNDKIKGQLRYERKEHGEGSAFIITIPR